MKPVRYGTRSEIPAGFVTEDCVIHPDAQFCHSVNLWGKAQIGAHAFVGPYTEIGGAIVGDYSRISSHCFLCPGVTIGAHCFLGHGVMFTNDLFNEPQIYHHISELSGKWELKDTFIGNCTRIGSNVTILPVRIGSHCVIGAGAVVTHDVPDYAVVIGNPGRAQIKLKHST